MVQEKLDSFVYLNNCDPYELKSQFKIIKNKNTVIIPNSSFVFHTLLMRSTRNMISCILYHHYFEHQVENNWNLFYQINLILIEISTKLSDVRDEYLFSLLHQDLCLLIKTCITFVEMIFCIIFKNFQNFSIYIKLNVILMRM